jgi:hypothetical protein
MDGKRAGDEDWPATFVQPACWDRAVKGLDTATDFELSDSRRRADPKEGTKLPKFGRTGKARS